MNIADAITEIQQPRSRFQLVHFVIGQLDALEAEEKQVDLEQTRIVMRGAERELAVLTDLFDESQKFTRDEIEHAQPEYWKARLTRQTNLQLLSGNVDVGQLTSLHNAGLLDELIAEREQHLTNGHQELHP